VDGLEAHREEIDKALLLVNIIASYNPQTIHGATLLSSQILPTAVTILKKSSLMSPSIRIGARVKTGEFGGARYYEGLSF
jgi:hypothetical protein